jgi:hypothetical protein
MDEVVEILVVGEGAAKIVNDEAKSDVFRFVAEQAWCVGALGTRRYIFAPDGVEGAFFRKFGGAVINLSK